VFPVTVGPPTFRLVVNSKVESKDLELELPFKNFSSLHSLGMKFSDSDLTFSGKTPLPRRNL